MDKGIEIICGEAIEELEKIDSNTVDLIVTDPPYNLNKDYGESNDKFEFDEYIEFSRQWLKQASRILKKKWHNICIYGNALYFIHIHYIRERVRTIF